MDKLTAIKIKYDDGTYSDEIPVSVLSKNVEWDNTHTLVDVLGSINVDATGTIQDQISQLFNEKVSSTQLQNYVASQLNTDVTNWLNTNVNPVGSAVIVDSSLTIQGAAADAKVVGNLISHQNAAIESGSAAGDMVYVTVDPDTHKVTATITNGTITKEKLTSSVQSSLNKADSAVQPQTLKSTFDGLNARINVFENNLGSTLCNQRYHQADVTEAWDNGTISTAIANQSFENIQLGNYITKTLSLPILKGHIDAENGTFKNYRCQIKFVDANAFYGYNLFAVTSTPHMAALIFGLPIDYMNPTHSTTTATDPKVEVTNEDGSTTTTGTGYTGYAGSYMHVKYLPAVVKALNNALGNGHLVAHNMMMGTAVGSSLVNRFGSTSGATSSGELQMDQYITLMTEAQIYGGTIWSSSGYDTGQANTKLAAFNLVRWNKFCGNRFMWLRDVASSSSFCLADNLGLANYNEADSPWDVVPLILLK